jgi:hypothetical protein
VTIGQLSFREALSDITIRLGSPADDLTLQHLRAERVRTKAEPFEQIEERILFMIDYLRSRGIRIGVENHARAHQVRFDVPGPSATPSSIDHREWYMADNLVTVELHLKP